VLFKYSGFDKSGKSINGKIDAKSEQEVIIKLKDLGVFPQKIKAQNSDGFFAPIAKFFSERYSKIPPEYLSILTKELSIYLGSGISLLSALQLLKDNQDSHKQQQFIAQIHQMIAEGSSFADALKRQALYTVPSYFIKTVAASEMRGSLDKALAELSGLIKKNFEIEKKVNGALTYPLFIFTVSMLVLIFLINYVIPKIAEIFVQLNQELPLSTRIVIGAGNFMQSYGVYLFLFFILSFIGIGTAYANSESFQKKVSQRVLKIPLAGKFILISEIARFSNLFASLLRSGIALVDAVNLSARAIKNREIERIFDEANAKIVEGKSFSKSLAMQESILPKSFLHAISVGEESGNLPEMMRNVAELYEFEVQNFQDKFLSLLEPAVILFMGVIVGFIIVSMLLPIFSISFT